MKLEDARQSLLSLRKASTAPLDLVGGKARGLGRLLEHGYRVPEGFVVPPTIEFCAESSDALGERISRLTGDRPGVRFAVRSSAAGEDSQHASWSGQFATFLMVPVERVQESIEACRASIHDERVADYARGRGLPVPDAMPVVVQEMVEAMKAGTIFTRGLATGDALVIEAVRGLGDTLVGGEVTPESVIVERDGRIRAVERGKNNPTAVLTDAEISGLSAIGLEIEATFGQPMDIEWAYGADTELSILQARPITATVANSDRPYSSWDPDDLFRWGPTDGRYFYISDYVVAACQISTVAQGATLPWTVLTFDDTHMMVWLSTSSGWYDLAERCFRDVCLDEQAMKALRRRYDVVCPRLEGFFDVDWEALSKGDLLSTGTDFYEAVGEFWLCTLPTELGKYRGEKVLDEALQSHIPHAEVRAKVTSMLFETDGLSGEQQKRTDLAATTDVTAYWETHRFDLSSYLGPKQRLIEEVEQERRELTDATIAGLKQRAAIADAERAQTIQSLNVPQAAVNMGRRLASVIDWQEQRKRIANRSMYIKACFLRRAAEILELEEPALWSLGFYEVLALLDGSDGARSALGERPAMLFRTDVERLSPSEARTLWLSYAYPAIVDPNSATMTGGLVAFVAPGPITGVARVVTDPNGDITFDDGDILVAPSTRPHYEPLMRRAGAVVTDEGGLTSHTATFCRENYLPGIVGMPNVTRLIREGERITFRADKVDQPGLLHLHRGGV